MADKNRTLNVTGRGVDGGNGRITLEGRRYITNAEIPTFPLFAALMAMHPAGDHHDEWAESGRGPRRKSGIRPDALP